MLFPFASPRPSQREFIEDVRQAVSSRMHLMAHAPAGLGKTAASLSPALEYALDNGKTVLFLTPRHSQHAIAIETLQKIRERHGMEFRVADIIGKKWLCNISGVEELTTSEFNDFCNALVNDERCRFFNETRNADKVITAKAAHELAILDNKRFHHAEEIKDLAKAFCPYELVTETARKSTVIIADYYHVFSPARKALLARIRKKLGDLIIIVDEAHNLPARIRDLMSQRISSFTVRKAEQEAALHDFPGLAKLMRDLNRTLDALAAGGQREAFLPRESFIDAVNAVHETNGLLDRLHEAGDAIREEKKRSYLVSVAKFIEAWHSEDEGYVRIIRRGKTKSGKAFVSVSYSCLDPVLYTKEVFDEAHATVLMSGTFLPLRMYRDILGLGERALLRQYVSPFPRSNRLDILVKNTTTQYSKRTEEMFASIAAHVADCCAAIPGNCAVFFPSYALRDRIFPLVKGATRKKILLEQQGTNKKERRQLYDMFVSYAESENGALLMGVSAGSFSEGVDLPGMLLNGVIIVGIPLGRPTLEMKALIDYYDLRFNRGWDYGYSYPAMNRCLQAAGRAIRSAEDRAVCVFIDERFSWSSYRKAFPSDMELKVSNEPEKLIRQFWG